ncbi:MAG TPA: hypothetical protein VD997_10605 [Phycisphaerales bacterium]|nr:hypothetical protein [Phycisphaerales bacterium]
MVAPVGDIKKLVQERLNDAAARLSFRLNVTTDKLVEGWIYLVVEPDRDNVEIEDYVQVLSKVEQELEQKHKGLHLLLLPALPAD